MTDQDNGPELVAETTSPPDPPTRSETIVELAKALAAAQAAIEPPKKGKTAKVETKQGPGYQYRYASLDDLIAAAAKALPEHGLSFVQDATTSWEIVTDADGPKRYGIVSVTTTLLHASGEWLRFGPFDLPVLGTTPQAFGSALTYARRYALSAALGVAAEEDDDAKAAEAGGGDSRPRGRKASEAQMRALHAVAKKKGISHEQMRDWAGANLGIETLAELTSAGAKAMRESLEGLPDAEGAGEQGSSGVDAAAASGDRTDPAPASPEDVAALWLEAVALLGSKREVLAWVADEFKVRTPSTKKVTAEQLRGVIALARESRGSDGGETAAEAG